MYNYTRKNAQSTLNKQKPFFLNIILATANENQKFPRESRKNILIFLRAPPFLQKVHKILKFFFPLQILQHFFNEAKVSRCHNNSIKLIGTHKIGAKNV